MNTETAVVYGLSCTCHPEKGIRYVGQTRNGFLRRLAAHKRDAFAVVEGRRKFDFPVYRWIRKHGVDNIVSTVLEAVDRPEELDAAEISWITTLNTYGRGGLNRTVGGQGVRGMTVSAETRLKMSLAHAGAKRSPEFGKKMSGIVVAARATPRTKAKYKEYHRTCGGPASKITADQVREIRELRETTGDTYENIGRLFDLGPGATSLICRRLTWPHVV